MKKFLKNILLFLAIILVVNAVLNIYFSKICDTRYQTRYNYFINHIHDYNTVFWGSSRTAYHCIPLYFDSLNASKNISTRTFNLGTPGNKVIETYYQYENFLKDYAARKGTNVKYALIEIQFLEPVTTKNLTTKKGYYYMNASNFKFAAEYLKQSKRKPATKIRVGANCLASALQKVFGFNYIDINKEPNASLYLGKNKDGYISLEDESAGAADRHVDIEGMREIYLKDTTSLLKRKLKIEKRKDFEITDHNKFNIPVNFKRIASLIKRSQDSGIKLYLVIQPRVEDYNEVLAVKYHFPGNTIELANPRQYPAFWANKYAYDVGHLNYPGARLFTNSLSGDFIKLATDKIIANNNIIVKQK